MKKNKMADEMVDALLCSFLLYKSMNNIKSGQLQKFRTHDLIAQLHSNLQILSIESVGRHLGFLTAACVKQYLKYL